jgi:hypothetical protein
VVGLSAGSQGLTPLDGLHSISVPLLSPPRTPVDLQTAASVFSSFFRLFHSIHLHLFSFCHNILLQRPVRSHTHLRTHLTLNRHPLIPSRPPRPSLHNGYTRSNQRCKDKSCVFRILCAHTCPYPFIFPSARAHIGCPALIPFLAFCGS